MRIKMADQWEAFGPIALIFWFCWLVFAAFAVVGLIVGSGALLAAGIVGFVVTTALFEIADVVEGRL